MVLNSNLLNKTGKYLYVEYTFLGYKGHLLETRSLHQPKRPNEPIFYRYSQKFEIKPEENQKQMKILKSMIAKNSKNSIKFLVVSEPIEGSDGQKIEDECEEIGWENHS